MNHKIKFYRFISLDKYFSTTQTIFWWFKLNNRSFCINLFLVFFFLIFYYIIEHKTMWYILSNQPLFTTHLDQIVSFIEKEYQYLHKNIRKKRKLLWRKTTYKMSKRIFELHILGGTFCTRPLFLALCIFYLRLNFLTLAKPLCLVTGKCT